MATAYPGTEGNPIFPCLTGTPTIIDEIASAGLTWRYYTPNTGDLWTAPCDIASFNCPNNPNVVTPQTQILTDIANNALANVSWVIPGKNETDHAGGDDADHDHIQTEHLTAPLHQLAKPKFGSHEALVVVGLGAR